MLPPLLDKARAVHGRDLDVLVAPIMRLAKHIAPAGETILWPGDSHHVNVDQLKDLIGWAGMMDDDRLLKALEGLPELNVIGYPAHTESDILIQAVLAHEIAHLGYENGGAGERIISDARADHAQPYFEYIARSIMDDEGMSETERTMRLTREMKRIKNWFRELACDRLAIHLVGPAFVFALFDVEGPRSRWSHTDPLDPGYQTHPGLRRRLRLAVSEARAWLPAPDASEAPVWVVARRELDALEALLPSGEDQLAGIEETILQQALATLNVEKMQEMLMVAWYDVGEFQRDVPLVWEKMGAGIPPAEKIVGRRDGSEPGDVDRAFAGDWSHPIDWRSVLAGSYLRWLDDARSRAANGDGAPLDLTSQARRETDEWREFNAFVRGSVELSELLRALGEARASLDQLNQPVRQPPRPARFGTSRGMLGRDEIVRRLLDPHSGLAVTPIVDHKQQIGEASIGLRLGPDFVIMRQATGLSTFDPARVDEIGERLHDYQDYVRRPLGSSFFLHPGEFALARTLEFMTLPETMAGQVNGRPAWGHLGLVIATAPHIEPSFHGTVTLELANLGTVPMVLYVGVRIAQLALFDVGDADVDRPTGS
jgi:dCTP deaminase